ncbi:hypothetical protein DL89DRAFT_179238 [Linderina pennispora]|uniref:Uncharacterized protein n=1 Tax=Linderina pennispora TaxID=61395 RepID=A0A1Y1W5P0_9FUNG|nr:uncharacterized protein DL89DRAFT_179238 [Linderina pennispora]ORX68524.1 hypothetical protein DL89DRAFT_179238 [Linderina pennispora]
MPSEFSELPTLSELAERARAPSIEMTQRTCLNMSQFRAHMRLLRKVDDNIILRLNNTNTASDQECLAFFRILQTAFMRRAQDIAMCAGEVDRAVQAKEAEQQHAGKRRSELFALRAQAAWVASERSVEDIVRQRSLDVFKARCQFFELPSEFVDFLDQTSK